MVEAHLIDFGADLYGQTIELRFLRWIRDQRAFESRDGLIKQIRQDIEQTRRWLNLTGRPDHVVVTSGTTPTGATNRT